MFNRASVLAAQLDGAGDRAVNPVEYPGDRVMRPGPRPLNLLVDDGLLMRDTIITRDIEGCAQQVRQRGALPGPAAGCTDAAFRAQQFHSLAKRRIAGHRHASV
jgi:hypothetical protein